MTVPLPESQKMLPAIQQVDTPPHPNECLLILKACYFEPSAVRALIDHTLKSQSWFSLIKVCKELSFVCTHMEQYVRHHTVPNTVNLLQGFDDIDNFSQSLNSVVLTHWNTEPK